ncbi:hypothetical protein HMI55_005673, partial [Coelomomyces lativittatus]
KPNWDKKINDPSILKKYENELRSQLKDATNFEKAILGLKQLLQDEVNLKQKYENPTMYTKEKLPSTFFDQIQLARKNNLPLISDALILPSPIQEKRPEDEDIKWLLEQSKSQPDFWDLSFNWNNVPEALLCSICNEQIRGHTYYAQIVTSTGFQNNGDVTVFLGDERCCERCKEEATWPMIKVQLSHYILGLIHERVLERISKHQLSKDAVQCSILSSDNLIPQALHD